MIYIPGNREFWEMARHEKMEVIFNDGLKFYITTHEVEHVSIGANKLYWIIKTIFLRDLSDVKQLIHNHFDHKDMTTGDRGFLERARLFGFQGKFTIYYKGQFYDQ